MIKDLSEIIRSGQVWNGACFKRVDGKVLAEWTKKVNSINNNNNNNNNNNSNNNNVHLYTGCSDVFFA